MESNTISKSDFDYLLILDFEAQCCNIKKFEVQEIIEFPVIIIDVKQKKVLDNYFHYYIKPSKYPILTDFCTELTGIKQEDVDNGISLKEALEKLDIFLQENNILNSSFIFVTCGDWDLKQCLRMEALKKYIEYRSYLKQWINIKRIFEKETKIKKCGMKGMLRELNLTLEGRHHSGIDDSRNIAKIALDLIKRGQSFTMNSISSYNFSQVKFKKIV